MSALRCAGRASPRTCTVEAPHIASLPAKVFLESVKKILPNDAREAARVALALELKPRDITRELLLLFGKGIVSIGHT